MTKQNNIPQLRFPEFKEAWNKKKLGEIATRITTKNNSNDVKNVFTNSAVQGIVNQRDFFDKDIANQNNLLNYYVVEKNDFIYNPRISNYAPVGPISRNHIGQGVMSPLYSVFKFKTGDLDFIETYFSTALWYEYLESIANYGARFDRMNITVKDFYEMLLPFPTLAEQTRIAAFFTAIDQKLSQLKQKKSILQQYKKGVMQKIFCLNHGLKRLKDDTDTKSVKSEQSKQIRDSNFLRFKDENGMEFPEWERKKLGEVAKMYSGGTPRTTKREYFNGNIPFIRSGEINSERTEQFISVAGLKDSSAKMVEKGDILYALYGATSGEVGLSKINGAINQAVLCIKSEQNHYYLSTYLRFNKENIINTFLQGGQGNLSAEIVKNIEIPIPSLPEQTHIANFLSSLDEKINQSQKEIEGTERWKKGLLQKMFC